VQKKKERPEEKTVHKKSVLFLRPTRLVVHVALLVTGTTQPSIAPALTRHLSRKLATPVAIEQATVFAQHHRTNLAPVTFLAQERA
jgi:hypothetical protein